jgi:hypothetical protein
MNTMIETTIQNMRRRGFAVTYFDTSAEALAYLDHTIDGKTVGVGGSVTLRDMGIYGKLSTHNQLFWQWYAPEGSDPQETYAKAATAQVYLTSVNAIAESGELINIDGTGNRVASTLYGHEKVYFVTGVNKIAENYDAALWRARNIASPKNAQRLNKRTPCAVKADKCYDCNSPERICRGLVVLWEPTGKTEMEVVLVGEELGY